MMNQQQRIDCMLSLKIVFLVSQRKNAYDPGSAAAPTCVRMNEDSKALGCT
jgi:hypothetical protein